MEAPVQVLTRGSSGATFTIRKRVVVKSGGPRVGAQGQWIVDHQSDALPKVYQVWRSEPHRYQMERLYDLHHDEVFGDGMFFGIIDRLQTRIWSQPPEVLFDPEFHKSKIDALAQRFHERWEQKRLVAGYRAITWETLPACLTHGDPTLDNVLLRRPYDPATFDWSSVVLSDPLPATTAVPDLRCVDIGKVYQSLYGYEFIRYGDPGLVNVTLRGFLEFEQSLVDENEVYAAHYWHMIHLLRCLPYVDERVNRGLRVQLAEALRRL
jgi:hypothetical protein